jgi:hypothetical protein
MARDITVTFDDGTSHVYRGAPDDVTPEAVSQRAAQQFGKRVTALDGGRAATPAQGEGAPTREERRAALIASNPGEYDPASPEWQAKYGPTAGMSMLEQGRSGLGKAMVDAGRGVGQLIGRGLDLVTTPQRSVSDLVTGGAGTTLSQRLGLPQYQDVAEARQRDAALMDTGAGMAGNIGGNVLMTLVPGGALKGAATGLGALQAARVGRTASQILRAAAPAGNVLNRAGQAMIAPTTLGGAAALGATTGALQPVTNESERGMNTAIGGLAGAGGQAAVNALARVVRPNTVASEYELLRRGMNPDDAARTAERAAQLQQLMAEGVTPTPGQVLGGTAQRVEEALNWLPGVREGQRRAVGELNTAAFNRALAPIGEKMPKGVQGREAVEHVEQALGDRYDRLMPSLTTNMDGQFINEINQLRNSLARGAIDPRIPEAFERILNDQVLVKFQGPNATVLGRTMKEIESELGTLWRRYRASPDPDVAHLGDAIRQTQAILRDNVARSNPAAAQELRAINTGWANFERAAGASGYLGADGGVFGAGQLAGAVKAGDRSARKKDYRAGRALMQDLSDAGKSVLGQKVPDSGTPFRSIATLAATGAAGGAGGLPAAAAVLAAPIAYSRPGQNALAALLARRGDWSEPVGNALRRFVAPTAGIVGSAKANARERPTND